VLLTRWQASRVATGGYRWLEEAELASTSSHSASALLTQLLCGADGSPSVSCPETFRVGLVPYLTWRVRSPLLPL
jgi:hypothetical protein